MLPTPTGEADSCRVSLGKALQEISQMGRKIDYVGADCCLS